MAYTETLLLEALDRAEAIAGVRRGDLAVAQGRERPLAEFLAEQRAKHGFPPTGHTRRQKNRALTMPPEDDSPQFEVRFTEPAEVDAIYKANILALCV